MGPAVPGVVAESGPLVAKGEEYAIGYAPPLILLLCEAFMAEGVATLEADIGRPLWVAGLGDRKLVKDGSRE